MIYRSYRILGNVSDVCEVETQVNPLATPSVTATMRRWDIFCRVVDNYGDIGTCWRLARQLADEHQAKVRLWVDDLNAFAPLCPSVVTDVAQQRIGSIEVRHWQPDFPLEDVADVVIEAFACELPASYIAAMAKQAAVPVWINLEYLSAEAWVEDCHLLESPHPTLPVKKYFFFPGFTSKTGGLLREHDLLDSRAAFDSTAQATFWREMGLPPRSDNELRISLFCYNNPALPELLQCWADGPDPVRVLVMPGPATAQVAEWFGTDIRRQSQGGFPVGDSESISNDPDRREGKAPAEPLSLPGLLGLHGPVGASPSRESDPFLTLQEPATRLPCQDGMPPLHRNSLTVHVLPFLPQPTYDRLLWACDVNFVRGEDSFVRAQWAQRPFIWQIYPQSEGAHLVKLDAFLTRYLENFTEHAPVRRCFQAWNGHGDMASAWRDYVANRQSIERHGHIWAGYLDQAGNLANNLSRFVCGN